MHTNLFDESALTTDEYLDERPDSVDSVSTLSYRYPLGKQVTTLDATYGTRRWRWVKNTDATDFAAGTIVQRVASTELVGQGIVCVTAKTPRKKLLGIAQYAIPAGSYGWLQFAGHGVVLGDGSVAANALVHSNGTSGRATTSTLTNADEVAAVCAVALAADGAAGSTFAADIDIP